MAGVTSARRRARRRGGKPAPSPETRRREALRRFPWPVLVLVPLAGVFLVMAVGLTYQRLELDSSGVRTTGRVVSVHEVYRGPDTALVEFRDGTGSLRQATVIAGFAPEVGSTVGVVYSPTDRDAVRLDEDLDSVVVLAFFWTMGIGLLVCIRQYVRRARRRS